MNLHKLLKSKKLTLSLAESCTGGSLSYSFTRFPGASNYLLGSIVAYSNQLKINLLGVSPDSITKFGAVSRQVSEEMAEGILNLTHSDLAISVTGVAGPTGSPVGRVWATILRKGSLPLSWKMDLQGTRIQIIRQTIQEIHKRTLVSLN